MTQNITPEQHQAASASPSKPLDGEIIGLEGDRVRVRLETGAIGFLLDTLNAETQSSFRVGQHGRFQLLRCAESEETILGLVSIQPDNPSPTFEQDVNQLHSALSNHHASPIPQNEAFPTLDEQRIQSWLDRAEQNLIQLKRNRAKRLDEEFYSGT